VIRHKAGWISTPLPVEALTKRIDEMRDGAGHDVALALFGTPRRPDYWRAGEALGFGQLALFLPTQPHRYGYAPTTLQDVEGGDAWLKDDFVPGSTEWRVLLCAVVSAFVVRDEFGDQERRHPARRVKARWAALDILNAWALAIEE
jgi:hypothetical protein